MESIETHLDKRKNLDKWLTNQKAKRFPPYSIEKGEKPYPKRYKAIEEALIPIHNNVEKGALITGAIEWMKKTTDIINKIDKLTERKRQLSQLIESDPIVHLNNHGRGHVNKVIEKVSELLHYFEHGNLSPYEGFLLLCAIQVHDIGNQFGREEHEKSCKSILDEKCKPHIPDGIERKVIERLALVHGGTFNGERDTIGLLSETKTLRDKEIRKRLLAALLRFGDELADDSTRADSVGLEQGTILEGSIIYHRYSEALHTVKIEKNGEKLQVHLAYEFDSDLAKKKFMKNGKNKFLLDEIYDRTIKMERERRYCMRFLRPFLSLDGIRVEIIIQDATNPYRSDRINYTLEEKGYPVDPASGRIKDFMSDIRSGKEEAQHLKREWSLP